MCGISKLKESLLKPFSLISNGHSFKVDLFDQNEERGFKTDALLHKPLKMENLHKMKNPTYC